MFIQIGMASHLNHFLQLSLSASPYVTHSFPTLLEWPESLENRFVPLQLFKFLLCSQHTKTNIQTYSNDSSHIFLIASFPTHVNQCWYCNISSPKTNKFNVIEMTMIRQQM
jgi:hypothetical protein